jgi:hypothetical protein
MTQTVQKKTLGQSQPRGSVAPMHTYLEAIGVQKQLQLDGKKRRYNAGQETEAAAAGN